MSMTRIEAKRAAAKLREPVARARELACKLGLDPFPVRYWIVDYDEMNQLIAYDGFQTRYPHWRWGMKYDRQRKQDQYGGGKAFEIVINDDPAHAFLQESNTLADQKAVITHVEAHADFFANNRWFAMFADEIDAAAMLERHADAIAGYMNDPEIDRADVERFIDAVLCIEDTIDQHRAFKKEVRRQGDEERETESISKMLGQLELSEEVKREVFDDAWLERVEAREEAAAPDDPVMDVLAFLREHGKRFDTETGKAVEMETWQKDVLEMLRAEAYYYAAQKMTKVMNEGWAAYWESVMMGEETFAGSDEFIEYADHQSRVLGSSGLNPYKLGKELWEYVENTANRREVAEQLLRIDGVTWRNFHEVVDFRAVSRALEPDPRIDRISADTLDELADLGSKVDRDAIERAAAGELDLSRYPWSVLTYEGLAERHFSLNKPQYRGFLRRVSQSELERISRYLFDDSRYASVEEALDDVSYTAGWDKMHDIRASHNDVTFLDEFLTQEFVDENNYFTYEYAQSTGDYRVSSVDYEDVKKKLLLQFTNFGKPTIAVYDGNYNNRGELLLGHQYNGILLDMQKAKRTLERIFELWGRPVNLMTIVKEVDEHDIEVARRRGREPEPDEQGKLIRYDGTELSVTDLAWSEVEAIAASDVDYDTKPAEWRA